MQVEAALMVPDDVARGLAGALRPALTSPPPPGPLSRRLAAQSDGDLLVDAPFRALTATDLRVTLVSLGDLAAPVVAEVRERVARAVAGCAPVTLRLDGLSTEIARSAGRDELVAARVAGDVDGLRDLHRAVVSSVEPLGLFLDRRTFVPRVVVATAPAPREAFAAAGRALAAHRTSSFTVDELALLSRRPDDDGGASAVRLPLATG